MKKLFLLACAVISFNSFAAGMSASEVKQTKQNVTTALNNSINCWNSGDLDCFMDLYVRDKDTLFISGTDFLHGWQDFYDHYKKKYGTNKQGMGHLEFTISGIDVLDSKHVFLYGRWKVINSDQEHAGVASMLFLKVGSKWQIKVDHSNGN